VLECSTWNAQSGNFESSKIEIVFCCMPKNTQGLLRGGPGRKPGIPNKATLEVRAICSELVSDLDYREKFKRRLHAGRLAPAVECMVWAYAFGKPKETLEIAGPDGAPIQHVDVSSLPDKLLRELLSVHDQLAERERS
jgi:hypothetical protein